MNGVMALIDEQSKRYSTQSTRETEAWEKPIDFDDTGLPVFDTSVFPQWLKDYVDGVAESTQTPVDAPSFACIALLSSVLSRKFEVNPFGDWVETLNTYTVMALGSANRKSAVFNHFIEPLTKYEQEQTKKTAIDITNQQTWLKVKQKEIEKLERDYANDQNDETLNKIYSIKQEITETDFVSIPRLVTSDVTPEKLAVLMQENKEKIAVLSPEGGEVFEMIAGRYSESKKANVDIYLKGHSADYVSVDRMGRESIRLYNPTMTVGLFVQPSVIQDIPFNFQDRGLTQRFLYSLPLSKIGYREIEPIVIDPHVKERFITNIEKLLNYHPDSPIQLKFTEKALEMDIDNGKTIEKMLRDEDISDSFQGWLGKLRGQIIRIAGLLHVVRNIYSDIAKIPTEIDVSTLQKASSLMVYLIEHAKKAHGIMGVRKNTEDQKYLLKVILRQNKEKIDYRTIQSLTRKKFAKSHELKEVLSELEERYFIRNEKEGRKNIILVNPKLLNN